MPVGKRWRNNPVARDFSFFVQSHPMKCAAARGFDPAQRRACAQLKRFTNAAALQRGNGLFHDANRLPRFGKQNSQSRIAVAFPFTWHVELEIFIAQIRLRAAQIADDARRAGNGSEQTVNHRRPFGHDADFFKTIQKTAGNTQPLFKFIELRQNFLRFFEGLAASVVRQIAKQPAQCEQAEQITMAA